MEIVTLDLDKSIQFLDSDLVHAKGLEGKKCIVLIGLSLHVDLIKNIKEALTNLGAEVPYVLTVVEREGESRAILEAMELEVIPLLVWEQTDEREQLTVSSVLSREHEPYLKYHRYFETRIPYLHDVELFLEDFPPEENDDLKTKLSQIKRALKDPEVIEMIRELGIEYEMGDFEALYRKAELVVRATHSLVSQRGGVLHLEDPPVIQSWLFSLLEPDDTKVMGFISFRLWPPKLDLGDSKIGEGAVPHINVANTKMAQQIIAISSELGLKQIRVLDLGAGLLGTTGTILNELKSTEISARVDAVEMTDILFDAAVKRAKMLEESFDNKHSVEIHRSEMLSYVTAASNDAHDFVTISYALHHLHPNQQMALMREVLRCLRPGGGFLIADPNQGKSRFNRAELYPNEVESVFSFFLSPEGCVNTLEQAGFVDIEIIEKDDEYRGFAVLARKPK